MNSEEKTAQKKKPKRAEREIYRPGALRLLKDTSNKTGCNEISVKKDPTSIVQPKKVVESNVSERKEAVVEIKGGRSKSDIANKDSSNLPKANKKVVDSKIKQKLHSNKVYESHSKYSGENLENKHYDGKKAAHQERLDELTQSMGALLPHESTYIPKKNFDCPEKFILKNQGNDVVEVDFEDYIPTIEFRKSHFNNHNKNDRPNHQRFYKNDKLCLAKPEGGGGKCEGKNFSQEGFYALSKNKEKANSSLLEQKERISCGKIKSLRDSINERDEFKETLSKRKDKNLSNRDISHGYTDESLYAVNSVLNTSKDGKSSSVPLSKPRNYIESYDISVGDESGDISPDTSMEVQAANPLTFIKNEKSMFSLNSALKKDASSKHTDLTSKVSHLHGSFENFPNKNDDRKSINYSSNSQGKRGIIHIENSLSEANSKGESLELSHQKILYNPNNPSKPLLIKPSSRDLPPAWDTSSGNLGANMYKESALTPACVQNFNSENEAIEVDPSVIHSIQKGELDLNYFVKSNQLPQEFRRIMNIRLHLKSCYRQLLLTDVRSCQEKNVEGALWKSLYYIIIEKLREYISNEPSLKERSLSTLLMLVDEGLEYFNGLLLDLQRVYDFSLETYFEEDLTAIPKARNRTRQALNSCQKILLSMGDLARYREQYNLNPNYVEAKKFYEKALQVNPRNGRPFNQLAIISVGQKRPLDIVYYYIRSLSASNPFISARDSLVSMFDDIRKKYQGMKSNSLSSADDVALSNSSKLIQEKEVKNYGRDCNLRREIWIRPDSGVTNKRTLSCSDLEGEKKLRIHDLQQLPHDLLMKMFLTGFLHCHGMLFTRVGLDDFNVVMTQTLHYFQALLFLHAPPKLTCTHLLQIMVINMFAIQNTELKDSGKESGYRSAAQDLALVLAQEMFSHLVEAAIHFFPTCFRYSSKSDAALSARARNKSESSNSLAVTSSPLDKNITEDMFSNSSTSSGLFLSPLSLFIPSLKIWCDWLMYHSSVWNPPPISFGSVEASGVDTWAVVGELGTIVNGIGAPDVSLVEAHSNQPLDADSVVVSLPEDVFLRAYPPLAEAHETYYYAPLHADEDRARDWLRVKKLHLCLSQFLCGVEPPVLRLQMTDQGDILIPADYLSRPFSSGSEDQDSSKPSVESPSNITNVEMDLTSEAESEEDGIENSSFEDSSNISISGWEETPLGATVKMLSQRKKALERRQKQQRELQALLEGTVTLEIEIRPRYLVPDTNCFIEKLDIIRTLLDCSSYTFMVPLIVLAELDGLSRETAVDKYGGDATHAITVREGAASALQFIKSNKNPRFKCVTSQGSVTPAHMFHLELDHTEDVTNDDKILSCCLHLCSNSIKKRPICEGVRRVDREVVLLTEDRNLRVKAYSRDVPVRELTDFAHWAGAK